MKRSYYLFSLFILISCSGNDPSLDQYDSILSTSNRIIIRFKENKNINEKAIITIISKPSQINELRDLMSKSTKNTACNYYDGTMTFFLDTVKKGYLEFSVDPQCPAFYFHNANIVTEYKMSSYCAMFLEGLRQDTH